MATDNSEGQKMLNSRTPATRALFAILILMLPVGFGCHAGREAGRAVGAVRSDAEQALDELGTRLFAAMPDRAPVTPHEPRRLLVFSRCEGFVHAAIPATESMLTIMGQKTGAFEVVCSQEMDAFAAENLAQFDAVLLNNTTQLSFENLEYRKNLLEFVRGGKGIIGIHASTDNFYNWPEAAEMMGGLFDGHPWTAGGTWAVKIDEPDHPLNRPFGGRAFLIKDEIYQIKGPYSRDTHRVLLSLDMTNLRNHQVTGIKREDNDFAISWVRPYGDGRVFYCSLGHNLEVLLNSAVLGHYLAGIQYALGDLAIDDAASNSLAVTPRPALTTEAGTAYDPFAALVTYDFDHSRLPLAAIEAEIRSSPPARHAAIEARLIKILENPESTFAARQFVCRMLRRIGPARSLPHLSRLLRDEKLSDAARFALQGHASPEVDRILRAALDELDGDLRIGVIGTIGQRRDEGAVPRIAALITDTDPVLAAACITALGEIGNSEAVAALDGAQPPTGLETLRQDALLRCADNLLADGAVADAQPIYFRMTSEELPVTVRVAAHRGVVRCQREGAVQALLVMFRSNKREIQQAAARFMVELRDIVDLVPIAEQLATLPISSCVMALSSLAFCQYRAAAPAVVRASESDDEAVQTAALSALGDVGDTSHVPLLAKAAAASDAAGRAAAQSLARLGGEGVDDLIINSVPESEGPVRAALIRALAARRAAGQVPTYLEYAEDSDGLVRTESFRALALFATDGDLPSLLGLLDRELVKEDRTELEKAIVAVCRRMEDEDTAVDLLLAAYSGKPVTVRASILSLLGGLPGGKSLMALSTATRDESGEIRMVAIDKLGRWPDTSPLEILLGIARESEHADERSLAFAGALRLAGLPHDRTHDENDRVFRAVLDLARSAEERAMVLDAVAGIVELWIIDFITPFLGDETTKDKAQEVKGTLTEALAQMVSHDAVGYSVTLANPYSEQYSGGGKNALTDGQWGSTDYGEGHWQGFQGEDLDAVIDLGREIKVHSIRASFLQHHRDWIFLPAEVTFYLSLDGGEYETVATFTIPVPDAMRPVSTESFYAEVPGVTARYVRVLAKNIGALPDWHLGAGGPPWLFADEIQVNPHFDKEKDEPK